MLKSFEMEKGMSFGQRLLQAVREAAVYSVILITSMLMVEIYGLTRDAQLYGAPRAFLRVIGSGVLNDLSFGLNMAIVPASVFIPLYLLSKPASRLFYIIFALVVVAAHVLLVEYYLQTLAPLGAELLGYSLSDIGQTIGAAGVPVDFVISATLMLAMVIILLVVVPKRLTIGNRLSVALLGLYATAPVLAMASRTNSWKPGPVVSNDISLDKSYYFYASCYQYMQDDQENGNPPGRHLLAAEAASFEYIDEAHFPFLHKVDPDADVLSPFFNKLAAPPNIVFIVVEGLGSAFSNADAYLGSFTPFLDSLSKKSLYWRNFLSAGGRTFAMPPSIFGSLPFGENGFLGLGDDMPAHLSLFNVLKRNGYTSSFFYGGDAGFDNMNKFMEMNGATVFDEKSFSAGYTRMPRSNSGFCWGFGDGEVFRRYQEATADSKSPSCNVVLTLSTHSPFLIDDQERYLELFEERMRTLGFSNVQQEDHRHYKNQYASILYADNAIRQFFSDCSRNRDFNNTIFIITGDHRMPEIPMSTKIDRYHVPLVIYSPLLKRNQNFGAVSCHFDLTPSLLSFLKHRYNFRVPSVAAWMGGELDTAHAFRSIHSYPLIQTKNGVSDYLMDGYMLNGSDLFLLNDNMDLEPAKDEGEKEKLKAAMAGFKQKNGTVERGGRLIPDSLLTGY